MVSTILLVGVSVKGACACGWCCRTLLGSGDPGEQEAACAGGTALHSRDAVRFSVVKGGVKLEHEVEGFPPPTLQTHFL